MSEAVRFFLESRVPELEDLFKKGLFSQQEIKDIVAKRTKFEHKIKRRGCLLDDFLAYIKFETDLEATRKERVALMKVTGKHSISDHSIVKYILKLYRRSVRKFRGNMQLWDQYIAFAQEAKANKTMTKIFASALQMHPECVDIWIKAARWELDQLANPASARALFLRALRINKNSHSLWLAYFQMELEVADTLASKRLEISDLKEGDEDQQKERVDVFSGAIPISIFKYAVKDCPLQADSVFPFYAAAAAFTERLSAVTDYIDTCVKEEMSAEAYKFHLAKAAASIQEVEKCMLYLNDAMATEALNVDIVSGVMNVLSSLLKEVSKEQASTQMASIITTKMTRILASAEERDCLSPQLYLLWSDLVAESQDVINRGLARFPESLELMQLKLKKSLNPAELEATIMAKLTPKNADFDAVLAEVYSSPSFGNELLPLARFVFKNGRPIRNVLLFLIRNEPLEAFLAAIDTSRLDPVFLKILLECLIESKIVHKPVVSKFITKLSVFCSAVYSNSVEVALLMAKIALMTADIELLNRIASQMVRSITFNALFEEMKSSFN